MPAELLSPPPALSFEVPEDLQGPMETGQPVNDLFEGIPFAVARAISYMSNTPGELHENIARFKTDPQAFTAALV